MKLDRETCQNLIIMSRVSQYETETFEEDMLRMYKELDPLYRLVHAYVRKKLRLVYPQIEERGLLPACVLGDMWGRWVNLENASKISEIQKSYSNFILFYIFLFKHNLLKNLISFFFFACWLCYRFWINIYSLLVPYPEQPDIDVTQAMLDQNYTVERMFRMGEEFFTSMGMDVSVSLSAKNVLVPHVIRLTWFSAMTSVCFSMKGWMETKFGHHLFSETNSLVTGLLFFFNMFIESSGNRKRA